MCPVYPEPVWPRSLLLRKERPKQASLQFCDINEGHKLPGWFLQHCVLTAQEITRINPPVHMCDDHNHATRSASPNKRGPAKVYNVESFVYKPLLDLLAPQSAEASVRTRETFTRDAVLLRLPSEHDGTAGCHFVTAVVQQFAKDAGANLIAMEVDDVEDLTEFLEHTAQRDRLHSSETNYMGRYFENIDDVLRRKSDKKAQYVENSDDGIARKARKKERALVSFVIYSIILP
jgi:hypothetical protein